MPVPVFVAVTVTPGINAPDASETVPPTVALIDCPNPITESNKQPRATDPERVSLTIFHTSHLLLTSLGSLRLFQAQNTKKRGDSFGNRSEKIRNFSRSAARCAVGPRRFSNQARSCGWAQPNPAVPSRTMRAQIDNVVPARHHSARYPPDAGSVHDRARSRAIVPRLPL